MEELKTYAIIRTGGKQYRVVTCQKIKVEKIEAEAGADITFSDVLFLKNGEAVQMGKPLVTGASVTGKVLKQGRTKKILVFHKRRKKGYKKLQGHRQDMTEVLIQNVNAIGLPAFRFHAEDGRWI